MHFVVSNRGTTLEVPGGPLPSPGGPHVSGPGGGQARGGVLITDLADEAGMDHSNLGKVHNNLHKTHYLG